MRLERQRLSLDLDGSYTELVQLLIVSAGELPRSLHLTTIIPSAASPPLGLRRAGQCSSDRAAPQAVSRASSPAEYPHPTPLPARHRQTF
jgi:hypothetical protein